MAQPPYGYGPYAPQAPPPKKKTSGCVIVAAIFGALVVLGAIAAGVGVYMAASSKEGKRLLSIVGEGAKILAEAQTAPGTSEVRALGCDQAMVLDVARLTKLVGDLDGGPPPAEMSLFVTCQVADASSAPSCDAVAKTYVGAVKRVPGRIAVTVQAAGENDPRCAAIYAPSGAKLHDLAKGTAPKIPGSQ